jgi:hypothetical protein
MLQKDIRDIVGGLLMLAVGAFVALYANEHYDMGELNRMGPGFFPIGLGALLAVLGFFIALTAFFRQGEAIQVESRTLLLVALSIALFAFALKPLGIVFATMISVFVASLADREITWKGRGYISVGIAGLVWLVFILGLRMILPVWPWSP